MLTNSGAAEQADLSALPILPPSGYSQKFAMPSESFEDRFGRMFPTTSECVEALRAFSRLAVAEQERILKFSDEVLKGYLEEETSRESSVHPMRCFVSIHLHIGS